MTIASPQGVRCGVAPILGGGSSSRYLIYAARGFDFVTGTPSGHEGNGKGVGDDGGPNLLPSAMFLLDIGTTLDIGQHPDSRAPTFRQ
jgi:hypothetical protein